MKGYLLVRAGTTRCGIRVADVVRVTEVEEVHPAPQAHAAVAGLVTVGGRLMPLVHLGALLARERVPATPPAMMVIARCGPTAVAFAVDDAETVERAALAPLPEGWRLSWADAVARAGGDLTPIVDMGALAERLATGAGGSA